MNPMSGRPTRKDIRLVLWGVMFGVVGQALYDYTDSRISPYLPPIFSGWGKVVSAIVVVAVFLFYLSIAKDEPEK